MFFISIFDKWKFSISSVPYLCSCVLFCHMKIFWGGFLHNKFFLGIKRPQNFFQGCIDSTSLVGVVWSPLVGVTGGGNKDVWGGDMSGVGE